MSNSIKLVTNMTLFLVVFLLVSNIPYYILSLRIGLVPWHFWFGCIVICVFLSIFNKGFISISRPALTYLMWNFCFLLMGCLSLFFIFDGGSMEQFIQYTWMSALGATFIVLAKDRSNFNASGYGMVVAVVLLAVLSVMEFLDPNFQVIVDRFFEDASKVGEVNRSGALYENSNDNGHVMVLGMFIGQFFLPVRLRLLFSILVGVAVFCTVSRASLTVWGLAVLISLLFGYSAKSSVFVKMFGMCFVVLLAFLLISGQIPALLVQFDLDQYMSTNMLERLSQNFFTQSDGSTEVRKDLVVLSLEAFSNNPLVGTGLGSSEGMIGDIGTHNQFLKIAVEQGILGLLVYLALFPVALFRKSIAAMVFVFLYFLFALSSHTMMSYPAYAIMIPMSVAILPVLLQVKQKKRRRRRRRSATGRAESMV
ncbi:hypothetical protein AB833_25900 [Chromatiales bacterium (ex Bugula neritina AB1)]|nr:hypothetical protein AB833_25900 [Chromatiales bacterium (ex Bugula neritina AB1)]